MITNSTYAEDPGADYYTRRKPALARRRAIDQLDAMGYAVELTQVKPAEP